MEALEGLEDYVREIVEKEGMNHTKLCLRLCELYLGMRGLSVRSRDRFCASRNICKTSQPYTQELDEVVCGAIAQVIMNHYYKPLLGSKSSSNFRLSDRFQLEMGVLSMMSFCTF